MIHNSSVISKEAKIGKNVKIGPFCYIGEKVELEDDVELISNVHIEGNTKVGKETKIYPFASIGTSPQDLKYNNELNSLTIGKKNIIREYVTISPGTAGGGGKRSGAQRRGHGGAALAGPSDGHPRARVGNGCPGRPRAGVAQALRARGGRQRGGSRVHGRNGRQGGRVHCFPRARAVRATRRLGEPRVDLEGRHGASRGGGERGSQRGSHSSSSTSPTLPRADQRNAPPPPWRR